MRSTLALLLALAPFADGQAESAAGAAPNVIWITIDDCGPDFASYGNRRAHTPQLDALARAGQRFTRAFVTTPVCSAVRSAMITGCYATTIGSHQHRSSRPLQGEARPITELLAEAGWRPTFLPRARVDPEELAAGIEVERGSFATVTGGDKEDFNFSRGRSLFGKWDPARKDEPFFALIDFNAPKTGQGTGKAHRWAAASGLAVDPASLELPPYWVDAPEVRSAYARYHEGVSLLDAEVGALLSWLQAEGLRDNTLLFVIGDHGLAMLRHKQWCYDTGLQVPLIVQGPGVEAGVRSQLVSSIDLAATTLAYLGLEQPEWMEGRDFLGESAAPRERVFASRDRCDETEDRVRAMRTERWKLIHNLRPEQPWVGRNAYTRRTFPNVELLLARKLSGTLDPLQALFMRDEKPPFELFDLLADPLELNDLSSDPAHAQVLASLRAELAGWTERTDAHNPFPEPLSTIHPGRVRPQVADLRDEQRLDRRPPNILLIVADDLGYAELGCYGQERIRTPELDRLAREGVRFTQYYSGHSVCAPSRCVLLTGLHTGHAQIRGNSPWASRENPHGEGQEPLAEGTNTVARWLSQRGYATACVGKWGLGGPGSSGAPGAQGFGSFFGYLCQKQAHDYYPAHLWRDGAQVPLANPGFTPAKRWEELPENAQEAEAYAAFSGEDYAPELMIEEALGWVREHAGEPFFLYFPTNVPHAALQVPEDSLAPYLEERWDEEPYMGQKGYLPHRAPRAAYAAMVSRMDRDVGRLLALLDELGLEDDTLVIFTSDNGPTYNGGSDSDFFRSAGELRGLKGSLYEGGLRVPFIARWRGTIPPGGVCDLPSGFQDLFPSLCELAGGSPPKDLDGASLTPWLLGDGAAPPSRALYWESGDAQAMRSGDWKIVRKLKDGGGETLELFDLASDPGERSNRATEEPELLATLREQLRSARTPSPNLRFTSALDDSP